MAGIANSQTRNLQDSAGFTPIPLSSLRIDSVTNFDIFIKPRPDQPYVLYAEKNIQFNEEARSRLVEHRITEIFIRTSQRAAYGRYLEDNLRQIISDESIPVQQKTDMLYVSACGVVENVLANPQSYEGVQRSRELVKNTVSFMLSDRQVFGHMLQAISTVYHLYSHSVNVMTYSVALAEFSGYAASSTLREIALGALLHDVGKSRIDAAILNSPDALTAEEWSLMKQHPRFGYDMLVATRSVGEVALDIVLHHHENVRGDGYPDAIKGQGLSPFVRVVSIADVFDALTTDRPWQASRNSFEALSLMTSQIAVELDRDLFRSFVTLMGSLRP